MEQAIIQAVQQSQIKTDLPEILTGDTVDVHVRIVEGAKERVQVFRGVVIAIKGSGLEKSIVVRRIVANEGVERSFPIHSPRVSKIEVLRHGRNRRAKLYYLRQKIGKSRRLQDSRKQIHGRPAAKDKSAKSEVVVPQSQRQEADAEQSEPVAVAAE